MLTPLPTCAPGGEVARQSESSSGAAARVLRATGRAISNTLAVPALEAVGAAGALPHRFAGLTAALPAEVPGLDAFKHTRPHDEELREDHRCGFVLRDGSGEAYNEEAFHYFLGVEHRRAQASGRPMLMLLLELEQQHGVVPRITRPIARRLFAILLQCLRDTDFVGWYRDGHLIGGVLTQHSGPTPVDLAEVVRGRLARRFEKELRPETAGRLRLRLYSVSPDVASRGE